MRQAAEHAVQHPPGTHVDTGKLQDSMLCREQSIQAQHWGMVAAAGNTMCHRTLQSRQCSANCASTAPPASSRGSSCPVCDSCIVSITPAASSGLCNQALLVINK
jgi:hypothetical protein